MADTKRCPNCGARNPVDAGWCGQCLERFAAPIAIDSAPQPATTVPEDPLGVTPFLDPSAGENSVTTTTSTEEEIDRGGFKVRGGQISWVCSRCETENPLFASECQSCGQTFADNVRPPADERPQRDPGTVALISLFLPGAGHAYLGMWGQAIARATMSIYAIFVVAVAISQSEKGSAMMFTIVFGLVTLGLWATTAHDAYREARNEHSLTLIKGRMLLYIVLGLLMLLMALIVVTTLRGQSSL